MSDQSSPRGKMEKPDSGLWAMRDDIKGGKYLVLRRDGTVFDEPNFVLGPRDPAAPLAMLYYAVQCQRLLGAGNTNFNQQYINDCTALAASMSEYRERHGPGDPGKGPHRKDHPLVIEQMLNPRKRILARQCRVCGCTEITPCVPANSQDACHWVRMDLCSACN